jgi:hypothetical protein
MEKEGDKIIMRSNRLQGVQKSFNNLEMVSSVRVTVTKLTSKIFKEKGIAYIGTRESLSVGDVIQVGNFSILYKVVKHQSKTDDKGNVYRIKRVDGFNITGLDIDGTEVGQKVIIKNRRSYQDIFNDFGDFNEPPCEPEKDLMCGYEEKECPIIPAAQPTPEPEPTPQIFQYRLTVSGAPNPQAGSLLSYIDENGLPINPLITIVLSKGEYVLIFCAQYGSIKLNGTPYYAANEPCPTPCVSFAGLILERVGDC